MGAMQRRKGATAEREVVNLAKDKGFDAKRTAPMQARGGGEDSDVALSVEGVYIEVKRAEKLRMSEWSRKAEADAGATQIPAVVYRMSREPWRVSLPLDDFFDLLKAANL